MLSSAPRKVQENGQCSEPYPDTISRFPYTHAVSYTHLDVYKRQLTVIARLEAQGQLDAVGGHAGVVETATYGALARYKTAAAREMVI